MSETVKSEKRIWAEKKRSGSEKQKRAAVSVQIGRIADKLLVRADGLDSTDPAQKYNSPVRGVTHEFIGPEPGHREAYAKTHFSGEMRRIKSSEETKNKGILRKPTTERTISLDY